MLDKSTQSIDNSNEPLIAGATIPVKVISIKSPGEFYCRHVSRLYINYMKLHHFLNLNFVFFRPNI